LPHLVQEVVTIPTEPVFTNPPKVLNYQITKSAVN